jgi:hypothetical protein
VSASGRDTYWWWGGAKKEKLKKERNIGKDVDERRKLE